MLGSLEKCGPWSVDLNKTEEMLMLVPRIGPTSHLPTGYFPWFFLFPKTMLAQNLSL